MSLTNLPGPTFKGAVGSHPGPSTPSCSGLNLPAGSSAAGSAWTRWRRGVPDDAFTGSLRAVLRALAKSSRASAFPEEFMNGNTIFAVFRTQAGIPRPAPWIELTVRWILALAARGAPEPLRERLAEEWSADLAQQQGSAARLRFAIGCCWAAIVISRETPVPESVAVVSSHVAAGGPPPVTRDGRR